MIKKSDLTKERILEAATAEFATYGVAGARVDRIARNSEANKNLIYVYFGSKEQLFRAVLERHLQGVYEQVPLDTGDLPGYAVRLFDFAMAHPDLIRLMTWYGLEQQLGHPAENDSTLDAKAEILAAAQSDGTVDSRFSPAFLLTLISSLAAAWSEVNPLRASATLPSESELVTLRGEIHDAVARLVTPPSTSKA